MAGRVQLQGIAWNHSRAFPPLVATAQRYEERHPEVRIQWVKRTLHEFGHANIGDLADRFDVVIMDHPWCGYAVDQQCLVPLDDKLPQGYLDELSTKSVGQSFDSYWSGGRLVALPVDAAAPTASYRADLLDRDGISVPETWEEVLKLAKTGRVIMPTFQVDVLLNFVALCVTMDERVFDRPDECVPVDIAYRAMDMMQEIYTSLRNVPAALNPIAVYEAMTSCDQWSYCPFAYNYSNYSRAGFSAHLLTFADTVRLGPHGPIRTVLGGTGLSISPRCQHLDAALDYAQFTASGAIQSTIYAQCGGQPAHRDAWTHPAVNSITENFFANTLATMDNAYLRPRYNGFIEFQESAGRPLVQYLQGEINAQTALDEINRLYRDSQPPATGC